MKTMKMTAVLAGILLAGGMALAADVTTSADVNSAYVWRGITFNDGVVVQPSVNVAAGGFGLNVWGNVDVEDYDDTLDAGEFSEVDITMSYSHTFGPLSLSAGYIEYLFPTTETGGAEGTRELYLDASVKPSDGLSLGTALYYDIDEVEDYYLNPYLGYGMEVGKGLNLSFRAGAGYAGKDFATLYGGGDSGFFDYTLSMTLAYSIYDRVLLSGRLGYTDAIDDDVLPEQDVNLYGGAGIAVTF